MKSIAAALIFFTRLPLWRIKAFNVPAEHFNRAINYWAVIGWLTAAVMAGVLWCAAQILPPSVAVVIAILSRVLLTGALHEDGLADFLDGFGGGTTTERTLRIMKDSHIGAYGVLGLIFYILILFTLLNSMSVGNACVAILIADPLCKLISSQITRFLTYARTEETSKARIVYTKATITALATSVVFGIAPLILLGNMPQVLFPTALAILTFLLLVFLMKRKINGYTGDCCGAMFLICELIFYLAYAAFV